MTDKKTRQRKAHTPQAVRITVTIPERLLEMVDKAASEDFTTRSDLIRMSLLWYLRPLGRDFDQLDPETVIKTLQHRKYRAKLRDMVKDIDGITD